MILTQEDLNAIEGLFSKRFDGLDQRIDNLEQRMDELDQRMDNLEQRMDNLDQRMDKIEIRIEKIEMRLDDVESDISALKVAQQNTNQKLAQIEEKVEYTYLLALENWGTLTETRVELGLPCHA